MSEKEQLIEILAEIAENITLFAENITKGRILHTGNIWAEAAQDLIIDELELAGYVIVKKTS